jgi:uncharacterized iron-regulated membrane protein
VNEDDISIDDLEAAELHRTQERVAEDSLKPENREAIAAAKAQKPGQAIVWRRAMPEREANALAASVRSHNRRWNVRPQLFAKVSKQDDGTWTVYLGRRRE